jgi:hypothetical protein
VGGAPSCDLSEGSFSHWLCGEDDVVHGTLKADDGDKVAELCCAPGVPFDVEHCVDGS